mgnify:CR=1 FL=1
MLHAEKRQLFQNYISPPRMRGITRLWKIRVPTIPLIAKVVKLSSFMETHAPRLIKMDIEGAELLALRGLGADYLKN